MNIERTEWIDWLLAPSGLLAAGLVVAVGLLLVPVRYFDPIKGTARTVLRPAEKGAAAAGHWGGHLRDRAKGHFRAVRRLVEVEEELEQLQRENRRLRDELFVLANRPPHEAGQVASDLQERLLALDHVVAHVLGRQARAFLEENLTLDVGSLAGIRPGARVIDVPTGLIDRGANAGLEPGQFALDRGCVWGQIVEVASQTSTVRTVTEPGYRDLVRLASAASRDGLPKRWGPRGILEGRGEPEARIRLIEVTEPVSVGDLVYTATGKGILPQPLLYGSVVRVERPKGASHWEIWMEPAARADGPELVTVLQVQLNPLRVTDRSQGPARSVPDRGR